MKNLVKTTSQKISILEEITLNLKLLLFDLFLKYNELGLKTKSSHYNINMIGGNLCFVSQRHCYYNNYYISNTNLPQHKPNFWLSWGKLVFFKILYFYEILFCRIIQLHIRLLKFVYSRLMMLYIDFLF